MDIQSKLTKVAALMVARDTVSELLARHKTVKLHIGCGTAYKEDWINIDNNSDSNIFRLDLPWDLRAPLPFPANSVDFIYHEHFLEHLTVQEGLAALADFRSTLKPGGIMRIAMPDLQGIVNLYLNPDWKEQHAVFFQKFGLGHVQTRAEMLNINFRWWGHQWLYDWEELERRLREVGFTRITRCHLRQSTTPDLQELETRNESSLIAEAIK